jgi:glycosyltransferase involved in cell wall biosynthesis
VRVLLVADVDPLTVIGGGERLLAGHAGGLAALGHEVVVCSGSPGSLRGPDGMRVLRVGRSPGTFGRAARAVRSLRPDIVVGYQPASAVGALQAARRLGIATAYVFSSAWHEEYGTRRPRPRRAGAALRRAVERASLRVSDRVVVLSAYSGKRLRLAHPGLEPVVRLVPGGVDPTRFTPDGGREAARSRLGFPKGRPTLLTVRNLVARMGLDNLVAALPVVAGPFPEVRLIVAGDGPLRPALEAQSRDLGMAARVRFAGFVPDGSLPDHYRAADLVVLPTRTLEGFGLTSVEALACGTPVLGTPVGAIPEILHPLDPALVSESASPAGIAAGIVRALRTARSGFADRARRHVLERYTWERVGEGLEGVMREVVR